MNAKSLFAALGGLSLAQANARMEELCGIVNFFDSENYTLPEGEEQAYRVAYGDWQTPLELAIRVCEKLQEQGVRPEVVVEPTCGTGSFVLAAAIVFSDSVKSIYGIEIFKPYLQQLKLRILEYALEHPQTIRCRIELYHRNIFDFRLEDLDIAEGKKVLLLGNPPWVTNSTLGKIKGDNLPRKTNIKNVKGIEAITGKGNFDVAESILYRLLDSFHRREGGCIALLIKSSVCRNVVYTQRSEKYAIRRMTQYPIDAQREFGVAVAASLFVVHLGGGAARQCDTIDFYAPQAAPTTYGWVGLRFASDTQAYTATSHLDGGCQLDWWSGIKHDCAKVLELERGNRGGMYNQLGEEVRIEPDLLYPLLKSSDLKNPVIEVVRKYLIVTQKSTSENTDNIARRYPLTYDYLTSHSKYLDHRASIIYKGRPRFCIFGVGSYSFKTYKVAISALYKTTHFALVPPIDGRSVMLDDTCYLMGFDTAEDAHCFLKILNSPPVQQFLRSIIFQDAKRCICKDLLMRIDLLAAIETLEHTYILTEQEALRARQYIHQHSNQRQEILQFSIF